MTKHMPLFETRMASTPAEAQAGQALRYDIFVNELGADGPEVDHARGLERDRFDAFSDQLLLLDHARPDGAQVVGVYRVMDAAGAAAAGQFYTESEFDIGPLKASGRNLLELGRSCVHADYRGGTAMLHLWQGLAGVVHARGAEVLFGTASLRGTDVDALAQPLSVLARDHLAPEGLRARALRYQTMDLAAEIDRAAAMKQVPALIKAYLRLGGFVGDGAYVDHAFNTTDVCLVLDLANISARQRAQYGGAT